MSAEVLVIGSGNAALCAALSARQSGARVHILEKAGSEEAGGNTWYTAGAFRVSHDGTDDLAGLLHDPDRERLARTEVPAYSVAEYYADLQRVTGGRTCPQLARVVTEHSRAAAEWLAGLGVGWRLQYERQSYARGGRFRFWGNLPLGSVGGGKGLVTQQHAAARALGITIRYDTAVVGLLQDAQGTIAGVRTRRGEVLAADAVVLACGGFQASREKRRLHLGPHWADTKVRGTRHNTGDGMEMALAARAAMAGDWAGCHAVAWDSSAPPYGDREYTNRYTKQSYPLGILVNSRGRRFIDEGADYRNYTYARLGRAIAEQPGGIAFQIFDARTAPLLNPDEYRMPGVSHVSAPNLEDLAARAGIDPRGLRETVAAFNHAATDAVFDPAVKDGKTTRGITPPKSNWALPLLASPFHAYGVGAGITFTYGGLRVDTHGRVLTGDGTAIPGLYAAGEIVGGLFYHNYPGGSGLSAGAVLGRRAGQAAAGQSGPQAPGTTTSEGCNQ